MTHYLSGRDTQAGVLFAPVKTIPVFSTLNQGKEAANLLDRKCSPLIPEDSCTKTDTSTFPSS